MIGFKLDWDWTEIGLRLDWDWIGIGLRLDWDWIDIGLISDLDWIEIGLILDRHALKHICCWIVFTLSCGLHDIAILVGTAVATLFIRLVWWHCVLLIRDHLNAC